MIANYVKAGLICLCALGMSNNSFAQTSSMPVKNIVLVHGAWADGSGWKGVYDILVKDGFNVSIVQEPETSFKDDVAATKRMLALKVDHAFLSRIAMEEPSLRKRGQIHRLPAWCMSQRTCRIPARRSPRTESAFRATSPNRTP